MAWDKTGTVQVTKDSNAVVGTGTLFLQTSRVGDGFMGPDGGWYEVVNITSDTSLAIYPNYRGVSGGGGAYAIAPLQGYTKAAADQLRTLVSQFGDIMSSDGFIRLTNLSEEQFQNLADINLLIARVNSIQAAKVDKIEGMGLSESSFTAAEKAKLAALESSHWKGSFTSLAALTSGVPSPVPGDYADFDVPGSDAVRYTWDDTDDKWVSGGSAPVTAANVKQLYESNPDTNAFTNSEKTKLGGVAESATANQTDSYLRNRANHTGTQTASTISNFAASVRDTVLTGISMSVDSAVAAGDSVLVGLGKLQAQISALKAVFTGATASVAGKIGLVPAPAAGDQGKVLKADGTWGSVGTAWGAITGTLTDQVDLKNALDAKTTGSKQQLATAIVCFNGTNTPAIISAFNVSSVTKVSTGIYDINFATAMDNIDFVVTGTPSDDSSQQAILYENGLNRATRTVNKARIVTVIPGGSARDFSVVNVVIYRGKN